MGKYKLVIFDFDGVIVYGFDQADGFFMQKYQKLACKYKLTPIDDAESFGRFAKLGPWSQLRFSQARLADYPFLGWDVLLMLGSAWRRAELYPEVDQTIQELSQNYILAIASRNYSYIINRFLNKNRLRRCFQAIRGRNHHPDKQENLKYLLNKFQIDPKNSVLITDTNKDLADAQGLGIKTIAVTYGLQDKPTLIESKPDLIIQASAEIPKAVRELLSDD